MRRVGRASSNSPAAIASKVNDLCDATAEDSDEIFDAYTVFVPAGFVPVRVLDLRGAVTAAQVANVLASLILDVQNRGVNRKRQNNA